MLSLRERTIIRYRIALACGPDRPLAGRDVGAHQLRDQFWLLARPSTSPSGASHTVFREEVGQSQSIPAARCLASSCDGHFAVWCTMPFRSGRRG